MCDFTFWDAGTAVFGAHGMIWGGFLDWFGVEHIDFASKRLLTPFREGGTID